MPRKKKEPPKTESKDWRDAFTAARDAERERLEKERTGQRRDHPPE